MKGYLEIETGRLLDKKFRPVKNATAIFKEVATLPRSYSSGYRDVYIVKPKRQNNWWEFWK